MRVQYCYQGSHSVQTFFSRTIEFFKDSLCKEKINVIFQMMAFYDKIYKKKLAP